MSEVDLKPLVELLNRSKHPEDVFGLLAGTKDEKMVGLKHQYRRLMDVLHPDHYAGDSRLIAVAQPAFIKATELYHKGERKVNAGIYGDRSKDDADRVDPDPPPVVLQIGKVEYNLGRRFAQGDLCDLYECTYNLPITKPVADPAPKTAWEALMEPDDDDVSPTTPKAVLKIVLNRGDNDLLENEATVLKELYPSKQTDEKYYRYLPKLIDSGVHRAKSGNRRVNILTSYDGYFSLAEVLGTYPNGLDYRDVVWMFKRLLVGLGFVHTKGFVHGAILPTHMLVHPVEHGARIIDWSYALKADGKARIKAPSKTYRTFYPPEVEAKHPASPETDIYMAAKIFVAMVGGDVATGRMPDSVPKPIQGLIAGCLLGAQKTRPSNAWDVEDELKGVLEKVVGKPKYRKLEMPPAAKA